MTREEIVAEAASLGFTVFWCEKTDQNTGKTFEVAYVQTRDGRELFAKDGSLQRGNFNLCNEFARDL